MKKTTLIFSISLISFLISISFIGCKKNKINSVETNEEPALPETPYDYYSKHTVNTQLATLGRVLFYDKKLSTNNAISCGSCHKQEFAFADNVRFNKGFNGIDLKRNSPSIQGVKGFNSFFNATNATGIPTKNNQTTELLFWDGRQTSLVNMVLNPVLNHNEMNVPNFETLANKLSETRYYPQLFKNAFGTESITKENIAFALQSFIACLNTTKFNAGNNNPMMFDSIGNPIKTPTVSLGALADLGKSLFHNKYNCARCHDATPQNNGSYGTVNNPALMFNIGLDEVYADNGLGAITGKPGDKGIFKVPTLKNISVTAPYMHDGRFGNLAEVLDHYSHNIKANPNLSPLFKNFDGTPKKLNILPSEKIAIIAFLNTLKDDDFLTSPMYSDPFKK